MPDQNSTGDSDIDAVLASSAPQSTSSGDSDIDAVLSQSTQPAAAAPSEWSMSNLGRQAGLVGRAMIQGAASLPNMVLDAATATGNILSGHVPLTINGRPNWTGQADPGATPLPSQTFNQALTAAGLPEPQTAGEKTAGLVESVLTGAKMPNIPVESAVPQGFQGAQEMLAAQRTAAIKNAMDRGYKVPPATTNPTALNKGLETVSGKIATQQAASAANQSVTNRLASEALGLNPEVPITEGALKAIRAEAAGDYQAIGRVKSIPIDQAFKDRIGQIVSQFNQTAEELPSLANKDLEPVAKDLLAKDNFSGNALLGAVKSLRNNADKAFRQGDGQAGSAYRQMSSAIEDAIDRNLSASEPGLVDAWRAARQKIAMAHTVEDALNPGTNNVQAAKLAQALRRGEPLSGHLRTIAEFANALPKAAQEPVTSPVSHLSVAVPAISGLTEAIGAHGVGPGTAAAAVAYPAARAAAKWYLMGPGQANALPATAKAATEAPWWLKGLPAVSGEVTQ